MDNVLELASASRPVHTTMEISEHIPLAPYTTFQLGGEARYFVRVKNVDELEESLSFAKEKGLQIFVLGGGSNLLVTDEGFQGLVIKVEIGGLEEKGNTLIAGAGESWDALVERAVRKNLWGIENLSGVPGTVGGAVVQNIGAYGAVLSQTLVWVEAFDIKEEKIKTFQKNELRLGYRMSLFKENDGRFVVLRAALELQEESLPNIEYKDLAAKFTGKNPTMVEIRETILGIRKAKFPDTTIEGTAGSFFKNPLMSKEELSALTQKYPGVASFSIPESPLLKVSLAWLLDHALNIRGYAVGKARLFEKQPLAIVAQRGASSSDVLNLAEEVKKRFRKEVGIEIEPEVKIL